MVDFMKKAEKCFTYKRNTKCSVCKDVVDAVLSLTVFKH